MLRNAIDLSPEAIRDLSSQVVIGVAILSHTCVAFHTYWQLQKPDATQQNLAGVTLLSAIAEISKCSLQSQLGSSADRSPTSTC